MGKKQRIKELEIGLWTHKKARDAAQTNLDDAVAQLDQVRNELADRRREISQLEDDLADAKAAWAHDKKARDGAEKELTELRYQLSGIRAAEEKLHNIIYPRLALGGISTSVASAMFPQHQKLA